MKKTAYLTVLTLLFTSLAFAAPGDKGKGPGKGNAPAEMAEAADVEAVSEKAEKMDREAKKARKEAREMKGEADEVEETAEAKAAGKPEKGDMPKGLEKQMEKKADQPQKDMEKASDTAKEKRRKWWKFWDRESD